MTLSVRLAGVSTGEDALDTSILLGVRSALQEQARAFVDVGGLAVETRDVAVQVQVPELRSLLSRIPGALEALGDQGAEVLETRVEPRTVRLVPLAESSQDERQE